MTPQRATVAQTFRGFWHGPPLGPYQLLCLQSFVAQGHCVEVFTYDRDLAVPDWITRRDAREILAGDHVLRYRTGLGAGSPALHANLFRYALLHQLGGWWVDLDVVLLHPDPTPDEIFIVFDPRPEPFVGNAIMHFPCGHALLAEAVERCVALGENVAFWGQTGPSLMTELSGKYGLLQLCKPAQLACPVDGFEIAALFDPARCDDIRQRCAASWFLHALNEIWREAGVPRELGPPQGSFLDWLYAEYDCGVKFQERMEIGDVMRWFENRNALVRLLERNRELEWVCRDIATVRDAVLTSTSWRISAPLRGLAHLTRRNPLRAD
jgi:hypothetical protein